MMHRIHWKFVVQRIPTMQKMVMMASQKRPRIINNPREFVVDCEIQPIDAKKLKV